MVRALHPDPEAPGNMLLGGSREGDRDDSCPSDTSPAGAQVEGNPGPAPVVDPALQGDECLGVESSATRFPWWYPLVAAPDHVFRPDAFIERKTLFFSTVIASGASSTGGSIATKARTGRDG